jgi:HSP20 family protein
MTLRQVVPWQRREIDRDFGREVNRLFDEVFRGFDRGFEFAPPATALRGFEPRIDVEEKAKEVLVTAELPGLEQKDFEIHLEGDLLTLRGEKREEQTDRGKGYFERAFGSFQRSIRLPVDVDGDAVAASFKDGILRITLPKAREAQVRTIPIRSE